MYPNSHFSYVRNRPQSLTLRSVLVEISGIEPLTFDRRYFHRHHAHHAPARLQRPNSGESNQGHHRLCRESAKDGQRQTDLQLSV